MHKRFPRIALILITLPLLALNACAGGQAEEQAPTQELTPAPTEAPMAARVNGEGIILSDYEQELQRFQAGAASLQLEVSAEDARQQVLDYLVEQTLFVQGAAQNGYTVSEAELDQKISELAEARGGQAGIDAYLSENFYSPDSFRRAVARELALVWMRNFLVEQAPSAAEQVRARQILVDTQNEAIAVQRRLEVGTPFVDLAYEYDPLTGGELGWFPRGYLFQPAVEDAAFALQPGQYSGTIETNYGFHIVEVIERDPQRELKGDALVAARRDYIEAWLTDQLDQAAVEIYVN